MNFSSVLEEISKVRDLANIPPLVDKRPPVRAKIENPEASFDKDFSVNRITDKEERDRRRAGRVTRKYTKQVNGDEKSTNSE